MVNHSSCRRSGAEPEHTLSIDVDDQVVAAFQLRGQPLPRGYRPKLRRDIDRTLRILSEIGARATFFVNAQYCDGRDDLFESIVAQGMRWLHMASNIVTCERCPCQSSGQTCRGRWRR